VPGPRLLSIHTPDASSPEAIVAAIIKPGMSQEQKALAIWRYCWENTWHWPAPVEPPAKQHSLDVVYDANKQLNVYGYTYCFAIRSLGEALYQAAGLEARSAGISGHVLPEVYFDGKYHLLDHDQRGFSRVADGSIASLKDYRGRAAELILNAQRPSIPFFPSTTRPLVPYEQKHVFTGYLLNQRAHYYQHDKYRTTHSMNFNLRPGDRFERFWGNQGKWYVSPGLAAAARGNGYVDLKKGPFDHYADLFSEARRMENGQPNTYGNGLLVYRPDLSSASRDLAGTIHASSNISQKGDGFGPREAATRANLEIRTRIPYLIVGWPGNFEDDSQTRGAAVLSGRCFLRSKRDLLRVFVSVDNGGSWQKCLQLAGGGESNFGIDFSQHVIGFYSYILRFEMRAAKSSADCRVLSLGIDTACQLNPAVLPAVAAGANQMSVTMQTGSEVFEETVQYNDMKDHRRLLVRQQGLVREKRSMSVLKPQKAGQPGSVVYALRAPKGRKIHWARLGGSFRSHHDPCLAPDEQFRIYYSLDRPGNWKLLWQADRAPYLEHWCFECNQELPLARPVKNIFVKYEMVRDLKGEGGRLVAARMSWGCQGDKPLAEYEGVEVTHKWLAAGKARSFSRVVESAAGKYRFNSGRGKIENLSVAMQLAGLGPRSKGPHELMLKVPRFKKVRAGNTQAIQSMRRVIAALDKKADAKTILKAVKTCSHQWVRNFAYIALMALGDQKSLAAIKSLIGKRDGARNCYFEMLGYAGPLKTVTDLLKSKDSRERCIAAELLEFRGDPGAIVSLREVIAREKNQQALAGQCSALVSLLGAEACAEVEGLLKLLPLRNRLAVAGRLARYRSAVGFKVLAGGLREKNSFLRYKAAAQLADCGQPQAEILLIKALRDSSRWVRREATRGLAAVGGRRALSELFAAGKREVLADVLGEIVWASSRIKERNC
jgi:HEAT repeats